MDKRKAVWRRQGNDTQNDGAVKHVVARAEESATVRTRVVLYRARQMQRSGKANAQLDNREIKRDCRLKKEDALLLEQATEQLGLSARAHHRILKVARTIADLADSILIQQAHLSEAISYRKLDRH